VTAVEEAASAGAVDGALRRFAGPVFAPATVYAIGQGAVLPVVAICAHELGAGNATAALIAGLPAVGVLIGDGPAGALVARIGEKRGMLLSALVTAVCSVVIVLAPSLAVLTVSVLVMGVASSVFLLARHSLLTELVAPSYRARALALLAGTYRAGMTVGPFLTAALTGAFGASSAFGVQAVTSLLVVGYLLVAPDPAARMGTSTARERHAGGLGAVFRQNTGALVQLGGAMAILMLLRTTMVVVIPLWGLAIGMSATRIAVAAGVCGLLQFVLVYTSGQIADRFGRRLVAVPVTAGLALGHLLFLGAYGEVTYFAVVCVLGVANGFGGGIMMTLGSDLAPPGRTSEFLGLWRLVNDGGGAAAPFLLAGGTAAVSLGFSVGALGVIGLGGAWMLWRWLPRYVDRSLL
jgi:MFS family permease